MRQPTRNDIIEAAAQEVLDLTGIARVPVPVDVVACRLGLTLEATPLGEGVSGVLVVNDDSATIGYNSAQHPVRQRFSIAHELGHYKLHKGETDAPRVFITTTRYVAVFLRNEESSRGEKRREIEANRFAAALLMPAPLIRQEVSKPHYDNLSDEELCDILADRFQVSVQAMSIRLTSLGILEPPLEL